MANKPYPLGSPFHFVCKNYNKPLSEIFGVVKVKVTCPPGLFAPILLTKRESKIIAPTGTWVDWYCSEELKNAIKYGYQVQVMEGCLSTTGTNQLIYLKGMFRISTNIEVNLINQTPET